MDKRNNFLIQLSLILFVLSTPIVVVPSGIVSIYGLFGEMYYSIAEEKEEITEEIASITVQNTQKARGLNVYNVWFEFLAIILSIYYGVYVIKLPREDTMVTLKVRMDN